VMPPPRERARRGALAPFAHRLFLVLFVAQLVSNIGTWMQSVGAVWLMGDLGGSPLLIASVQTASTLPDPEQDRNKPLLRRVPEPAVRSII
jgi:hypothetical protein